jgi:hypothetical protein
MVDWHAVYVELKGWQTGIGSLLGFVALGAGALINYHLSRRRDKHVRSEEISSVALALYGEVLLLRISAARLARFVGATYLRNGASQTESSFDKYFQEMVEIPEPRIFPALAPKIGMLPPLIALEIVKFYARIDEAKAWLPRMQDDPDRKYSYSIIQVIEPAVNAVRFVAPALQEIEKLTGLTPASLDLDLKDAMSAWDIEQEYNDAHD